MSIQQHVNAATRPNKTSYRFNNLCPSPAWWLLQGGQTRSHPELGRQTPQRQWYYVSRPGRVGRRQACQVQRSSSPQNQTKGRASKPRPFVRPTTRPVRQAREDTRDGLLRRCAPRNDDAEKLTRGGAAKGRANARPATENIRAAQQRKHKLTRGGAAR
jgi:hypothetical protein